MIQIRTAILHNGIDSSVEYANKLAEQITDECVVTNVYTEEPLKNALPVRAVPNVMVCLFCEGLEEYQKLADIINQLTYIKRQPENETAMDTAGAMLTDEQALTVIDLYDEWNGNKVQVYDGTDKEHPQTKVQRLGDLYKCNISHVTQPDWPPELTPNLWTKIAAPGEYREIKDGMLSTEAFAKGEIGWYKTKDNLYESLFDGNVYTPDSYPAGWRKVGE